MKLKDPFKNSAQSTLMEVNGLYCTLNMPAAVKMTVFGLLLGSFLTPVYVDRLMGAAVDINMLKIFKQSFVIFS